MASTYLSRTPSSAGNRKKFTISLWVKRTKLGIDQYMVQAGPSGSEFDIRFNTNDQLRFSEYGGGTGYGLITNRVFRDVSAWMHLVFVYDSAQATDTNRNKIYVNGEQISASDCTAYVGGKHPPQNNDNAAWNNNVELRINDRTWNTSAPQDSLYTHIHNCDGYAYQASDFGETDATSGIWKPKTAPSVTHGTNGFFLKFENSGNLDLDSSTNAHTFTTTGTLTQNIDTPSNNYATLNPLIQTPSGTQSYERANTRGGTGGGISYLTLLPNSGKWFVEYHFNATGGSQDNGVGFWSVREAQDIAYYSTGFKGIVWKYAGNVYLNGANNAFSSDTFASGDIISIAMDFDNDRVTFYKNGSVATNLNNYSFPFSSYSAISTGYTDGATAGAQDGIFDLNAGQNPTFGGRKSAGTNTDGNGQGLFSMAVPSGYYAICTKNIKDYG